MNTFAAWLLHLIPQELSIPARDLNMALTPVLANYATYIGSFHGFPTNWNSFIFRNNNLDKFANIFNLATTQ